MKLNNLPYWIKGAIMGFLFAVFARGILIASYIFVVFEYGLDVSGFIDNIIIFISNPIYFMFFTDYSSVIIEVITSVLFYTVLGIVFALLVKYVQRK